MSLCLSIALFQALWKAYFIWKADLFYYFLKILFLISTPNVGLALTTRISRVSCSTDSGAPKLFF